MGRASRKGSLLLKQAPQTRNTSKERARQFQELTAKKLHVHYLEDDASVKEISQKLDEINIRSVGLDFETASKNGKYGVDNGSLRLIQIGIDEPETGPQQIVIDCFRASPKPILKLLRDPKIEKQIHNMAFEQEWSQVQLGARIQNVYDTCLAFRVIQDHLKKMDEEKRERLLPGWRQHDNRLATLIKIYLNMEMPKEGQSSDWSKEKLQPDQIVYAAMDSAVMPLITEQVKKIAKHVGCEKEIKERIRQEDKKINSRVKHKKRMGTDDSVRIERALKRAANKKELERLWQGRLQMTVFADNKSKLKEAFKERQRELLGGKR